MKTILVIDDEPEIRTYIRFLLERYGYDVLEAADGFAGLQLAGEFTIALVVCDLFMPEMEGLESIQRLRASYPAVPIVAMSGGSAVTQVSFLGMAAMLGATRTLQKPFKPETLRALLNELAPLTPDIE